MINFKENTSAERRVVGISCRGNSIVYLLSEKNRQFESPWSSTVFDRQQRWSLTILLLPKKSISTFHSPRILRASFWFRHPEFRRIMCWPNSWNFFEFIFNSKKKKKSNLVSYHYFHELIWIGICCLICKWQAGISSQELSVNESWLKKKKNSP